MENNLNDILTEKEKELLAPVLDFRKTITYLSLFTLIYIIVSNLIGSPLQINPMFLDIVTVLLTASVVICLFIYRRKMNNILNTLGSFKTAKFNIGEVFMIIAHLLLFVLNLCLIIFK